MKTNKGIKINNSQIIFINENLHCFKRGNKVLIVEPDTASWIIISLPLFRWLRKIKTPKTLEQVISEDSDFSKERLIEFLIELYNKQIISIDHKYRYKVESLFRINKYPYFFCIHVTKACNFKCTYCYACPTLDGSSMPLETLKKILYKIITEIPLNNISIEYHGGEPILALENILKATDYAQELSEKMGKSIQFLGQTNGSLVTAEVLKEVLKRKISLGFSLDGDKIAQDRCRLYPDKSSTFNDVWKNFKKILDLEDDFNEDSQINKSAISVVVEPQDYFRTAKFFIKNKLRAFCLHLPYIICGRAKDNIEMGIEKIDKYCKSFLDVIDIVIENNKNNLDSFIKFEEAHGALLSILTKERDNMCARSPCGSGNSILTFDILGNIYPCDLMINNPQFILANIYNCGSLANVWEESSLKDYLERRHFDNIIKCKNCAWKNICNGGCIGRSIEGFNNIFRESLYCRFYSKIIEELIWRWDKEPKKLSWVLQNDFLRNQVSMEKFSFYN